MDVPICPFCRSSMESLGLRVLLTSVADHEPAAKRPSRVYGYGAAPWTVPTNANVCKGCGFVALFEV